MNVGVDRGRVVAANRATAWPAAVLLPWALSRGALYLLAQYLGALQGRTREAVFALWDGAWYLRIAHDGYGFTTSRGETPYPFFPLLPGLLHSADALGMSPIVAGVVLNHLVFLLALWGVYDITRAHGTPLEATLASWSLAFFPGSVPLTLLYPCTIFLACSVWAFRALELERDAGAATLVAVAALARPNGAILAISCAWGALRASRSWQRPLRVVLPAAIGVVLWMAWLWSQTGDALAFVHAKAAWREVTLASLLAGTDPVPKADLAPLALAALLLALAWRRLPGEWLVFAALALLPSLGLGILGMPRYAAACFPVSVAAGIVLARLPQSSRVVALGCAALALFLVAQRIFVAEQMP